VRRLAARLAIQLLVESLGATAREIQQVVTTEIGERSAGK